MITGQEFLEKLYSAQEEYTETEERLYSTGDSELDELLERAFCEGYEYAQAEFSEDKKEDDEKLSEKEMRILDKLDLWQYDHLTGKYGKKLERDRIDQGSDKEATKRVLKRAGISSLAAPLVGAGVGAIIDKKEGAKAGARYGAAAGAGLMLGTGLGIGAKKLFLKNESYKKAWDRQRDLLDVSEGKMSKKEFIDKWGKEKKKKNK